MEKIIINDNGRERELVKVVSKNKCHAGFYTTYRDMMGPDDKEYKEPEKPKKQIEEK
jgi:hypothetical protein